MMRPLSVLPAIGLILLLVGTGQALAIARGAPLPVGQIEPCAHMGPVMVPADAGGAPVSTPQYCPDGLVSLLGLVALADPQAGDTSGIRNDPWATPTGGAPVLRATPALARGPPDPAPARHWTAG